VKHSGADAASSLAAQVTLAVEHNRNMKQRMTKALKIGGIFISGLLIGAILMNFLYMYVLSVYRDTIRINFKTEQEFLSSREFRQGEIVRALVHRWNVVNSEADDGFRAFNRKRNKDIDESFLFPFQMLALKSIMQTKDGVQEKGARIAEGIDRGRLALSLESIGAQKEADKQWEISRMMTDKESIEEIRRLIIKLQSIDNTEVYRQAEKAVLAK
jgi:hypothetical protein